MAQPEQPLDFEAAVAHLCSPTWAPTGVHVPIPQTEPVLRTLLPATRREEGRTTLGETPNAIPHLVAVLRHAATDAKPRNLAIRILKNLCVRSTSNQRRAADANADTVVLAFLSDALQIQRGLEQPATPDEAAASRLCTPFHGYAVEFLVNFATGNERNAERIWKLVFPHVVDELLRCENKAAAAAAGAMVHNCVTAAPHRMPDLVASFPARAATSDTETSLLHTLVSLMRHEEKGEKEEERFAWSYNIVRRLIRASMMRHCFETLGPSLDEIVASTPKTFTPLQTTFLHIVDAGLGKSAEGSGELAIEVFAVPENGIAFFNELIEAVFLKQNGSLLTLSASIVGSIVIINDNSDELDELRLNAVKIAVHALQAMAVKEKELRHGGNSGDSTADETPSASQNEGDPTEGKTNEGELDGDELRGLRGMMVRLIAVCSDECAKVQDSVRNLQGIPFVMNALSYEKEPTMNPFLREWAVLAVRNLTLGNETNAKEISSYELVGVQNDRELLEKAGLEAFLDSESGRPRLRQKERVQ